MGLSSSWVQNDDDTAAGEDSDGEEDGSDEVEEVGTGEDVGCAWG